MISVLMFGGSTGQGWIHKDYLVEKNPRTLVRPSYVGRLAVSRIQGLEKTLNAASWGTLRFL